MNGSILKKLRGITSWWLILAMVFSSFGSLGQVFAAIPTMTATTADNDNNGTVDAIVITFSEAVSIADGSSGDGLSSLTLGNGCVIAAGNYASSGTTTLVLSGLTNCAAGNTGITPAVTYAQVANCSTSGAICDIATTTQMAPAGIVATDRVKPVLTSVTLSISYANLLSLAYSEPVVFAKGVSSASFGNLNDGVVSGIGSFSSSGIVTSTGNTISGSGNNLVISLATATGGFIPASAALAPSGVFTAFSGTFVMDAAGNPVNTSGSVAVTGSPSWDFTEPVISSMNFIPSTGTVGPGGIITLTITADLPGYNPGTITVNGVTIPANQFTDTGTGQYTALYQVGSGDTSRASGTIPASVTLLDDARNLTNPFTSVATNTLSINASWTGTVDTTPPVISGVSVTATGTVANYSYTVADSSNVTSVIYLGTGTNVLGNLFASGSSTGTGTRTGTFSGLTTLGNYYYFIRSVDAFGNTGTTSTGTLIWIGGTGGTSTSTGLAILNSRVDGLTSSRATVRFDFSGTGFTSGTGATGSGYVLLSTWSLTGTGFGTGVTVQSWILNISTTGSVQTASSSFSGLTADSLYSYVVSLSSGTGNVSATGSFVTAGDPIVLTGGAITQTGATTLTGTNVPVGGTLAMTGTLTIVSDLRESLSLSGRLTLSGITGITVSGSTWNGVLLPPSRVPSGALENASLSELSTLIASLNTVNGGITTTHAGNIFQTVKAWGDAGVTLVPVGSNFIVSFIVPSGTGSTGVATGSVLRLYRSANGGTWEANSPDATCTLDINKMCTFSTNRLSFFAPAFITATTSTGSTGGGTGGGSSGGWGGSFLLRDNCPGGDTSPSYYDRICGGTSGTGTTGRGMTWTGTRGTGSVGTGTVGTGSTGGISLRFTDISTNWARDYIEELARKKVVDNATFFRPDDDITRAEFLKMSLLGLGVTVDTSLSTSSFTDVSDTWQIPLIEKARDMGIISGQVINGMPVFRPNDPVSRSEAMKMLINSAGITSSATTTEFVDVQNPEQIRYIERARELWIVSGQVIGWFLRFRPNDRMTRAEVAKVVVETMQLNLELAKVTLRTFQM